jgi:hypothetical protein
VPTAVADRTQLLVLPRRGSSSPRASLQSGQERLGRQELATINISQLQLQIYAVCLLRPSTHTHHFFPSLIVRSSANCAAPASPPKRPPARGPSSHKDTLRSSTAPPRARPRPGSLTSSPLRPPRPLKHRAPSRASRPLPVVHGGPHSAAFLNFAVLRRVCPSHPQSCLGVCPSSVSLAPSFMTIPSEDPIMNCPFVRRHLLPGIVLDPGPLPSGHCVWFASALVHGPFSIRHLASFVARPRASRCLTAVSKHVLQLLSFPLHVPPSHSP